MLKLTLAARLLLVSAFVLPSARTASLVALTSTESEVKLVDGQPTTPATTSLLEQAPEKRDHATQDVVVDSAAGAVPAIVAALSGAVESTAASIATTATEDDIVTTDGLTTVEPTNETTATASSDEAATVTATISDAVGGDTLSQNKRSANGATSTESATPGHKPDLLEFTPTFPSLESFRMLLDVDRSDAMTDKVVRAIWEHIEPTQEPEDLETSTILIGRMLAEMAA